MSSVKFNLAVLTYMLNLSFISGCVTFVNTACAKQLIWIWVIQDTSLSDGWWRLDVRTFSFANGNRKCKWCDSMLHERGLLEWSCLWNRGISKQIRNGKHKLWCKVWQWATLSRHAFHFITKNKTYRTLCEVSECVTVFILQKYKIAH